MNAPKSPRVLPLKATSHQSSSASGGLRAGGVPSLRVTRGAILAQRLSWLVAVILVLLPFHALLTTWAGSNFGHLDVWRIWKEILLLLALPFMVYLALSDKLLRKWFIHSPNLNLFMVYVLVHVVLGIWAYTNHNVNKAALGYALIINLRFIFFFVFCAVVAASCDWLKNNWRQILLVPAGVVVAFGLLQKLLLPYDFLRHFGYGKGTIPAYHTIDNDINLLRIQSTLRGPNPLGAYLVLILIALDALWRKKSILWSGITIGTVAVLFYSHSRSAWIGLVLSLLTLIFLNQSKKIKLWLLIGLGGLVILVGAAFALKSSENFQETLLHDSPSVSSSETSNQARLESLKAGVSDIIHEPLGRGPGTAGPASARNDQPARIAENYFLQIGQEVGVLGIAIFVTINILVAKELWQRRTDQLAKILLASFVGLTFVNLLSHAWTDDTIAYLWWGLAGIALVPSLAKVKR